MIGELHPDDIEDMLYQHHVGQLACIVDDRPLVSPITYTYDAGVIYGHTAIGQKAEAMRRNPQVSFGIQEHEEPDLWRSVVVQGVFEEIIGETWRANVLAMLEHIEPHVRHGEEGVVFCLRSTTTTGRWFRASHERD